MTDDSDDVRSQILLLVVVGGSCNFFIRLCNLYKLVDCIKQVVNVILTIQ